MTTELPRLEVEVRAAVEADAAALTEFARLAFSRAHERLLDEASVRAIVETVLVEHAIRERIREGSWFLLAHSGARLVGFLEYDDAADEPELRRLYVDPLQKRRRIGSALLRDLHRRLPPGLRYRVVVAADNTEAIEFYRRHGFREAGRASNFYPGVAFLPDAQPTRLVFLETAVERKDRS